MKNMAERMWIAALAAALTGLARAEGPAGRGPQPLLRSLDAWEVCDHPDVKKGRSNWTMENGALANTAAMRGGRFGTDIVTRETLGDGTFRFRIEVLKRDADYGFLFHCKDEQNYARLQFGGQLREFLRVTAGTARDVKLPPAICYVPPRHPTWVDLECRGGAVRLRLDGEERLCFTNSTPAGGRFGFFGTGSNDFVVSDVAFYAGDAPPLKVPPAALKKPYAFWCTRDEARVAWETNLRGRENAVEFSAPTGAMRRAQATTTGLVHVAVLNGLQPGVVYTYRCFTDGVPMGEGRFRADPGPGQPMRFGLIGDNQTHPAHFRALNALMMARQPDIVLNAGDIVERGSRSDWDDEFFTPNEIVASRAPYFAANGNHHDNSFFMDYYLPYPGEERQGVHEYAARYGCFAFLVYDDINGSEKQQAWFEKTLAAPWFQEADWRAVLCHKPAYCVGWRGWDGAKGKRGEGFLGLLARYKVQFLFQGHTHDYERGYINGVYTIVSGGGGGGGESFGRMWDHVQVYQNTFHYCLFDVSPWRVELTCQGEDGAILDHLVVEKDKPGILNAVPELASRPADKVAGGTLAFSVKTPALGERKVRYLISYDLNVNSYRWTPPAPASQAVPLSVTPLRAGKYRVRIVGMDEDGRTTKPGECEVEWKSKGARETVR